MGNGCCRLADDDGWVYPDRKDQKYQQATSPFFSGRNGRIRRKEHDIFLR
jgi:hypothetical protein